MQEAHEQAGSTGAVVNTAYGAVRGRVSENVETYLGIPYAASPVGSRRFALPQPPAPWQGVRDTTDAGATAPHRLNDFPALDVAPLAMRSRA